MLAALTLGQFFYAPRRKEAAMTTELDRVFTRRALLS
jgi:hypothetical protein